MEDEQASRSYVVDEYINYFCSQLKQIAAVENRQWQKALLFSYLEALARGRFGPKRKAGFRFAHLLREHSGWEDAERVSIPQLKEQLIAGASEVSNQLSRWIKDYPSSARPNTGLKMDPCESDFEGLIETDADRRFISLHRHDCLLYAYRSTLVHEARQGGGGVEIAGCDEPFYLSTSDVRIGRASLELIYPLAFLKKLIENALVSLREFYTDNHVDPYSRYSFGTLLQPVFNQFARPVHPKKHR